MTEDLVAYLKADTALVALLGSACKIYPNFAGAKDPSAPYLVYRIQSDSGRALDNVVNRRIYGFSIFAATALAAEAIKERLDVLLDKDAAISIPSTTHHIKSSWLYGGSSMYEQDTQLHHRAALYTLLYV
jgi:hypothetical protein